MTTDNIKVKTWRGRKSRACRACFNASRNRWRSKKKRLEGTRCG